MRMREKNWHCWARFSLARSPWRDHIACVSCLQQRQPLSRTLLSLYRLPKCSPYGSDAQCVVHALKGLACHARVTPASSPASHCKQCSALTSPSLHARGCASPSGAHRGHKNILFFNGCKTWEPGAVVNRSQIRHPKAQRVIAAAQAATAHSRTYPSMRAIPVTSPAHGTKNGSASCPASTDSSKKGELQQQPRSRIVRKRTACMPAGSRTLYQSMRQLAHAR
jgi:hypothetical protein